MIDETFKNGILYRFTELGVLDNQLERSLRSMKKFTVILSILFVIGLVHQGVIFAEGMTEKKAAKTNFGPKKKHNATTAPVTTPAPTPSASPVA